MSPSRPLWECDGIQSAGGDQRCWVSGGRVRGCGSRGDGISAASGGAILEGSLGVGRIS